MRDYRYQIEYKSGKSNPVADHLSRPMRIIRHQTEERWLGKTREELKQLQQAEPRWLEMTEYLEGGRIARSKYPRATLDQFVLEEEILYLTRETIDHTIHYLLVLPSDLKQAALNLIHNRESGHLGQKKSISKAEELFYWPNLKMDVWKFVKRMHNMPAA